MAVLSDLTYGLRFRLQIIKVKNVAFERNLFPWIGAFYLEIYTNNMDAIVFTSGSRGGGGTEAMASPKRQTREAKLCFGLPQTGQWVYLVSTESTDFTGFVT